VEKREAAIVAAYTGTLIGKSSDMHEYIEEKLQRPVFMNELADEKVVQQIKDASKQDFCSITITG